MKPSKHLSYNTIIDTELFYVSRESEEHHRLHKE